MTKRLLGVVLCGGQSSRMGRDKSCLRIPDGRSFRQIAIDRFGGICDDFVISGGENAHGQTVVADPRTGFGPVIGIAASLRYATDRGFDACLFTPVDTPCLTTDDLLRLKATWVQSQQTTLAESGRIQPLIGIYRVSDLGLIEKLAASESRSLHRFIRSGEIAHTTVPLVPSHCRNINTPDEFENYVQ